MKKIILSIFLLINILYSESEIEIYNIAKSKTKYFSDEKLIFNEKELLKMENNVDIMKLNKYFLDILNDFRKERNLNFDLKTNESLIEIAKIRANDLTTLKKLSHNRPNGDKFYKLLENKVKYNAVFENLVSFELINYEQIISEKYLAEKMFELWRQSFGHYKNMLEENTNEIGINFSFTYNDDAVFPSIYASLILLKNR